MINCIFCQIVRGEAPCHKFWEDEEHIAFLSIFPNTPGFSVVIPRRHYSSYAFDLSDEVPADDRRQSVLGGFLTESSKELPEPE